MNELSDGQKTYLKQQNKHRWIVRVSRIAILLIFLLLWEVLATTGLIDSFIFSSPSKVIRCFLNMILNGFIFVHLWTTFYETIVSFSDIDQCLHSSITMVQQKSIGNIRSLLCRFKQSSKVSFSSTVDCMAWSK